MKQGILTALMMLLALQCLTAQEIRSILKVRLSDNTPVMIRIDKRYYDEQARLLTIDHITPGRHRLKVFAVTPYGFSNRALVYDGYCSIEPGTMNYLVVDRAKGTMRINTTLLDSRETGRYPNDPIDRSKYGGGNDRWRDRDERQDEQANRYRNGSLSLRDMDDLGDRVNNRITDTDKIKLLKSALTNYTYTSEQVGTMLGWLSFDQTRLEFAKWAFTNVADRRNYWKLEDKFSFSATKEDFNDFLNGKR